MAKWDLYSIWFGLVAMLVVALLVELLFIADFSSLAYWFRLIAVVVIAALSVLVFMQRYDASKRHNRQMKKLEKVYAGQIRRKNMQIKDIKKKNDFLIKTALKQAERAKSISDQARMLFEKKK